MSTDQKSLLPCNRCFDLGLWLTPGNELSPCPDIAVGAAHAQPNPAAVMIAKALQILQRESRPIDNHLFAIARSLVRHSTDNPRQRTVLIKEFFDYLPMSEKNQIRKLQTAIEELRRNWLLPVGSRKEFPAGYWIIVDEDDFKAWVTRSTSAPITQLTTIHRVARRNFPIFAEQMDLDFFSNVEPLKPAA